MAPAPLAPKAVPLTTIRLATERDIPAMVGLLGALFAIEADFTIDPAVQQRGLALLLARGEAAVLVACAGESVVGMASVQLTVSTARGGLSAGIEDVIVAAGHRGTGLGRRLIEAAEAWARAKGAVRLALLADETNAAALDFYDRLGFARTRLVWLARPLE